MVVQSVGLSVTLVSHAKTAELIKMPFGLRTLVVPGNHVLEWVQIPRGKGQFWGKGSPIVKYKDFLPWVVQKLLNRLIWHLGCGLWWAEGSTSSIIFARWCQCAHMEGHIVPPGKYDWTIHLRWRCSLMSNYFDHLFTYVGQLFLSASLQWCCKISMFLTSKSPDLCALTSCMMFRKNNLFLARLPWISVNLNENYGRYNFLGFC